MTESRPLVVVSPHLDDAVLSCAGAIRAQAVTGTRVVVVTVFTEGRRAEQRRAEDRAALALLGAEAVHLGPTPPNVWACRARIARSSKRPSTTAQTWTWSARRSRACSKRCKMHASWRRSASASASIIASCTRPFAISPRSCSTRSDRTRF